VTWRFEVETAVEPAGPGRWRGRLDPHWNIGDNPNGGYAAALVQQALIAEAAHPDPVSITIHFLRPALADADATVETELVRAGRTVTSATGRLVQDGVERLRTLALFSNLAEAEGPDHEVSLPTDIAPPSQCRPRQTLEQGVELPIASRLEVRVDPRFAEPGVAGVAEMRGWIRMVDGRPPDSAVLALFADAFPPSLFPLLGRVGWVPTLEMTVHVRRRPAPGWIRARFTTQSMVDGYLVEDGQLWDATGRLVADSRQLALLRTAG